MSALLDAVIPTPKFAKDRPYAVSDHCVIDFVKPENIPMVPDTDGSTPNGATLLVGIKEKFTSNKTVDVDINFDSLMNFVDAVKANDNAKARDCARIIAQPTQLITVKGVNTSLLSQSERNCEYSMFHKYSTIMQQATILSTKGVRFLNPSRGSVVRASKMGIAASIVVTIQNAEYRKVIEELAKELKLRYQFCKGREVDKNYLYYCSFRPQIAADLKLPYYIGFQPNPTHVAMYPESVKSVVRTGRGYKIEIDRHHYIDSFNVWDTEMRCVYPCDLVTRTLAKTPKRTKHRPGYSCNIEILHDFVSTHQYVMFEGKTVIKPGIIIPIKPQYLIADVEYISDKIMGKTSLKGKVRMLDDLTQHATSVNYRKSYVTCLSTNTPDRNLQIMREASFMRTPYLDTVAFLGYKFKYADGQIHSIFYKKGKVVRPKSGGSIVVDGAHYEEVIENPLFGGELHDVYTATCRTGKGLKKLFIDDLDDDMQVSYYN